MECGGMEKGSGCGDGGGFVGVRAGRFICILTGRDPSERLKRIYQYVSFCL